MKSELQSLALSYPHNFSISYKINPYMDTNATVGDFETDWDQIITTLNTYTDSIETIDFSSVNSSHSVLDHPDLVFLTDLGLSIPQSNELILSNFAKKERENESEFLRSWCESNEYTPIQLSKDSIFEGGDAKWDLHEKVLWLGYGNRTNAKAVEEIDSRFDFTINALELVTEDFFHLDMCFTPLSKNDVLIIPEGLSDRAVSTINNEFRNVYTVPESDRKSFAGNSVHVTDDCIAVDRKNTDTIQLLQSLGYTVIQVDTTEFNKAGGSIDCLILKLF